MKHGCVSAFVTSSRRRPTGRQAAKNGVLEDLTNGATAAVVSRTPGIDILPKTPESTRDTRDTRDDDNNQLNDKENFVPDEKDATRDTSAHPGQGNGGVTDDAFRPGCKNTHTGLNKPTKSRPVPDDPDVPDGFPPNGKGMPPANDELGEEELL